MNDTIIPFPTDASQTLAELIAQHRAACEEFYAEHREVIDAARPAWAQQSIVDAVEGDEADLVYRTAYGTVEFACTAEFVEGVVSFPCGSAGPNVALTSKTEGLTAAEIRGLASDLLTAARHADVAEGSL
ncbi:hypothetical protein AB3M89_13540 [Microbacterium sp. 179-I 3D2 NHS]|uniref:hypothetical protein n=1 Tax=Microbacterium sp. 179-I 3D2 NHS TaxID=3235178 RepID=UPI00399FB25C